MAKFKGSTFQVGDVVEITKESSYAGMLDFVESKGYKVIDVYTCFNPQIKLRDEGGKPGWFASSHFKLKESTVESNENHFKVGQTVWDVVYGKGEVVNILQTGLKYPVVVEFVDGKRLFTEDGKLDENYARTLFFSEPKIIAETKPTFAPTFKKGDVVIISGFKDRTAREDFKMRVVEEETEELVFTTGNDPWDKYARDFYRLGEKIEFN